MDTIGKQKTFDELFEAYNFTKRAEDSIRNYSNWLLGITLGLAAGLISFIADKDIPPYFLTPLISVFIGICLNGYIKYKIHDREIQISVAFGIMKKKLVLGDRNDQKTSNEFMHVFKEYEKENNKIVGIRRKLKWASFLTFLNVLITGVFIFWFLIN